MIFLFPDPSSASVRAVKGLEVLSLGLESSNEIVSFVFFCFLSLRRTKNLFLRWDVQCQWIFCRTAQLELDGFNRHCHAFVDFPLILTTVFCVWYWYPDPGSHFRCLVESIRIANAYTFSFSRCFVSPQSNQKAKIEFSFLVKEYGNYNFAKKLLSIV